MATKTFDVVIVGAGSAGCALANRLSSDPTISVALLEAGGADDREAIRVPRQYFSLWGTDVDWNYASTPQRGTAGRVHQMPRGRVLGGTSSINGMVYLRGAAADYDGWAAAGAPGWEWVQVRSEFEALEQWVQPAVQNPLNPTSVAMVEAAIEAGFPRSATFDEGVLDGSGWNKSTIRNGERFNANRAFLQPIADRANLHILPNTRALSLVLDGARVTGVVVQGANGATETLAAGEVVLAAGAFDSPRLLLRAGIGPAAELARLGIAPVADLPVGENFHDHLLVGIVYDSLQPISEQNAYCTEGCAFTRSTPDRSDCDIEISFATTPHFAPAVDDGRSRFTIIPGITKPKSRGTVRLTSAEPDAPLEIDPNYFDHPDDMATMITAVRLSREIAGQPALAPWNGGEHFPGVDVASDDAITRYVESTVSTWFHPVGTCRMGSGPEAVVDPELRVHGVAGLRVADASIMPEVVGVNTNAACMLIGWRAGSLMLG